MAVFLFCRFVRSSRAKKMSLLKPAAKSAHPGVAFPLDGCHFSACNIDIKRAAAANSNLATGGNRVVTRRKRDPEVSLRVGRERRDRPLFIRDGEIAIRKRRRTRHAFAHRPRMNWA